MILWGPPGSGKTTLAQLISGVTKSYFAELSAVTSGVFVIFVAKPRTAQHRIGATGYADDTFHRRDTSFFEVAAGRAVTSCGSGNVHSYRCNYRESVVSR